MMAARLRKSDFAEHYARMDDEAIVRLSSEYGSLVEEAREALDEEISKRNRDEARKALDAEIEKRTPDVIPSTEPGDAQTIEHRVPDASTADSSGAGRGRYVGLTILLLLLALSMSLSAFTLFSSINDASGSENAGRSL